MGHGCYLLIDCVLAQAPEGDAKQHAADLAKLEKAVLNDKQIEKLNDEVCNLLYH